jgi:hypothetical protein
MMVVGPTARDIERSAHLTGVSISDMREVNWIKHSFVIRRSSDKYKVYRANKDGTRRMLGEGVCPHGHIDFMRDLLNRHPDALIKTTYTKYHGLDHFERKQKEGDGKAGLGQLCDCDESE